MAFIDASGDIILDAVLTDTGRQRLARADGSFKVAKFALGDDEINYGNYDKNHASGSAFYDLEILQTPILQAFTNNASSMNSKLISISRNNLLYLPVVKLNEVFEASTERHSDGVFIVAVDEDTEDALSIVNGTQVKGVIFGENVGGGSYIRTDQGLDTAEVPPTQQLDQDLRETQYLVRIDNRFGKIASRTSGDLAAPSFIDDDDSATYLLGLGTDVEYVQVNTDRTTSNKQTITGPRGTYLQFSIQASIELNTSRNLFTKLGTTGATMNSGTGPVTVDYIDAIVRVEGGTTGLKVDIPVRFVKVQ